MEMASGHYLNVFSKDGKTDVFVIFNEANSEPSAEELDAIKEIVEKAIEPFDGLDTGKKIRDLIEDSGLECAEFGVHVLVGRKRPTN